MRTTILAFLLASLCVTPLLFGQGPHGGGPPDPATMVQRRVAALTALLSLTAAQQQQATTIFTNEVTAEAPLRDNMRTAHQTLSDAVKSNNLAGIDQAASTIGTLTAQSTAIQAKTEAAFYQILTADQQTKYNERHHDRGGFGGPGPRGFGGR